MFKEIDQHKEITLSTSLFGEDGAAEVGDIRSKTILSKNCKSFKVPKVRLENALVEKVELGKYNLNFQLVT